MYCIVLFCRVFSFFVNYNFLIKTYPVKDTFVCSFPIRQHLKCCQIDVLKHPHTVHHQWFTSSGWCQPVSVLCNLIIIVHNYTNQWHILTGWRGQHVQSDKYRPLLNVIFRPDGTIGIKKGKYSGNEGKKETTLLCSVCSFHQVE